MAREPLLEVEALTFSHGEHALLRNVTFHVHQGEIVALLGRSGTGKTTLFRLIAGITPLQHGSIRVAGRPSGQQVSYMMQEDLLLPWRTVLRNLLLCAELCPNQQVDETTHKEALRLLQAVGMGDHTSAYPEQLSGGMRQRAALARSLLQHRPLLLLDEPFGALDLVTREEMFALVQQVQEEHNKTILLVTHDFHDALQLADRIYLLVEGEIAGEWKVPVSSTEREALRNELSQQLRTSVVL